MNSKIKMTKILVVSFIITFSCLMFNELSLHSFFSYAQVPPKGFVLLIKEVLPGSVAEKSGLLKNDLIYSFGGKVFYDSNSSEIAKDFVNFVNSLTHGTYKMEVLRKGDRIELSVNIPSFTNAPRLGVLIETLENDPQAYFDKALKALKEASNREELKRVADFFEKAKLLSPEWTEVYYNLGLLYEELDYYDLATENFLSCLKLSSRKVHSKDAEECATLTGRNKKKQELLESIKSKMEKGRWVLVKKIPEGKIIVGSFSPKFKRDKNGNLWMANSHLKTDFLLSLKDQGFDIIEKSIMKYPWFQVMFDGRYFEIRQFFIWVGEDTTYNRHEYFPIYILFRGEIMIDPSDPMIKVREYSWKAHEERYPDAEVAEREGFKKFKYIPFDLIRRFRYEYHYKLE